GRRAGRPGKSTGAPGVFLIALDRQYGEARRTQFRGPALEAGSGPVGQTGGGILPAAVRRDGGAGHGHRVRQRLDPPVLSPPSRVPREELCRWEDPRRVLETRGAALGRGDPVRPGDRAHHSAAVYRRIQERGTSTRRCTVARSVE